MKENERLKTVEPSAEPTNEPSADLSFPRETVEIFLAGEEKLMQTERMIFDLHTTGKSTKEIMAEMNITENTLKFHNKNIYGKLGVSSRKELVKIYAYISTVE